MSLGLLFVCQNNIICMAQSLTQSVWKDHLLSCQTTVWTAKNECDIEQRDAYILDNFPHFPSVLYQDTLPNRYATVVAALGVFRENHLFPQFYIFSSSSIFCTTGMPVVQNAGSALAVLTQKLTLGLVQLCSWYSIYFISSISNDSSVLRVFLLMVVTVVSPVVVCLLKLFPSPPTGLASAQMLRRKKKKTGLKLDWGGLINDMQ